MRLLDKMVDVTQEAERWILDVIGKGNSIEIPKEDMELFYEDYSHVVVIESNDDMIKKGGIAGVANIDGILYVRLVFDKEWLCVHGKSEVIYEIMLFLDYVNKFYKGKEVSHDDQ